MLDIKSPPKKYLQNKKIDFVKIDVTNFVELKKVIENTIIPAMNDVKQMFLVIYDANNKIGAIAR